MWVLVLIGLLAVAVIGRAEPTGQAVLLDIKGAIGPAASDYVARGLDQAAERGAAAVILRIDTPGGLDSSMRDIVKAILAARVPVIGYVAPSGARAASAGTYILYATHVAAMAPGTDLGAATPVQIGAPGLPTPSPEKPKEKKREDKSERDTESTKDVPRPARVHPTMQDKAVNEAVAYIRGLAEMHGRNADWAEKAVREAASLPAKEALEQHVIDLVAGDIDALLKAVDGRTVTVAGKPHQLSTTGLEVVAITPDWRSELLGVITNPNVAYILLLVGIYGILLEFYNPGGLVPGITGAISLLLALYAFQLLPINFAGLALLLLGVALMVAEALVPSVGMLGFGGVAAFVIGSIMLLDTDVPGFGISWMLIGSIALVSAGIFLVVLILLMRARRRAVVTGPEEMVGSTGEVIEWSGHEGRIRVHGIIWQARSGRTLEVGRDVRVAKIDGLTLIVQPERKRRKSS
jgi:membrane-bound serine protease (ClpP class)